MRTSSSEGVFYGDGHGFMMLLQFVCAAAKETHTSSGTNQAVRIRE